MRDSSVSNAKGIAIILMVMAHARCAQWLQWYINMFHMPLFLFMSGYCFKTAHFDNSIGFVSKRLKGAYWPFVKWEIILLMLHNTFFVLNIYNTQYGSGSGVLVYSWEDILKHAFCIIAFMTHGEQLLPGYWFLKSLLIGSFLFFFVERQIFKKPQFSILGGVILFCLTIIMGLLGRIPVVNIACKDVMASFFIWTGYYYRRQGLRIDSRWSVIAMGAVLVAIGTEYWQCSMVKMKFRCIVPYIISALAGTLSVLGISTRLLKIQSVTRNLLVFVGNHTLSILTWHILAFKFVNLLIISIYKLPVGRLSEYPVMESYAYQGWWIVYTLIGVLLPLIIPYMKAKCIRHGGKST